MAIIDAFAYGFLSMTAAGLTVELAFRLAAHMSRQFSNPARHEAARIGGEEGYSSRFNWKP